MKSPAVYMLASQRNGTLYIGVTSDLVKRVWQHREGLADGFTKEHGVKMLVWYEEHETMDSAIGKEKAMKKWLRQWKLKTIEQCNPDWVDLWSEITGETAQPAAHVTPPQTLISAPPVIPANAGIQKAPNERNSHSPTTRQQPAPRPVVLAKAGTQIVSNELDSRLRGNDGGGEVPGQIGGLL